MRKELQRTNTDVYRNRTNNAGAYYMYTANAVAREYWPEYDKEQEQAQKQQVRKAPRKKKAPSILPNLKALAIIFVMGLGLVGQYVYIQNLGYHVSQSRAELKVVLADNEKMKQQFASLSELQTIEAYAVNQLGMVKPDGEDVLYLPKNQENTVSDTAQSAVQEESVQD